MGLTIFNVGLIQSRKSRMRKSFASSYKKSWRGRAPPVSVKWKRGIKIKNAYIWDTANVNFTLFTLLDLNSIPYPIYLCNHDNNMYILHTLICTRFALFKPIMKNNFWVILSYWIYKHLPFVVLLPSADICLCNMLGSTLIRACEKLGAGNTLLVLKCMKVANQNIVE